MPCAQRHLVLIVKDPGPSASQPAATSASSAKGIETVDDVRRSPGAADALLGDAGRGLGYILGALRSAESHRARSGARRLRRRAAYGERRTMGKLIAEHQAIR